MRWLLTLATALMFSISLTGCGSSPKETVVTVAPQKVEQLAVEPPSAAMIPPAKAIPLVKGAADAENSATMRQNNLSCSNDRAKLIILQEYVKTLFNKEN